MDEKTIDSLIENIPKRHSTRKYENTLPDDGVLQALQGFVDEYAGAFPFLSGRDFGIRICKTGALTSLGSACHAVFHSAKTPEDTSALGFFSELFVLYATSLGLSTCYLAMFKRGEACSSAGVDGDRFMIVSPIGYGKRDFKTKLIKAFMGSRKPVREVMLPQSKNPPPEVLHACDMGTLAPSARNAQCWRFNWDGQQLRITAATDGFGTSSFDIGLCAAHVYMALDQSLTRPEASLTDENKRAVWTFRPEVK